MVRGEGNGGEPTRIGAYELQSPVEHLGLSGLWYARRQSPPFLAGPSVILPIPEDLARARGGKERIVRSARRAQSLRHPALVRVQEVVATDDHLAVVVEAMQGFSLDYLLRSTETLGEAFRSDVLLELGARLLDALHDIHGLAPDEDGPACHGRVSLHTTLFCPDGRVRLIGFGLPSVDDDPHRPDDWNARLPTKAEKTALNLGALSDQYAVGLVLLQLATGRSLQSQVPREPSASERAEAVERMMRRLSLRGPLTPPLLRLLAPNPAHRFANAAEAAEALRHPRGPYAEDTLEALVRRSVGEAASQDNTEPEGVPVDILPPRDPMPVDPEDQTQRSGAPQGAKATTADEAAAPEEPRAYDAGETAPSDWDPTEDTDGKVAARTKPKDSLHLDLPQFQETAPSPMDAPVLPSRSPMDLSRTDASEEAGMAPAVARAWAETDGAMPSRRFDASDVDIPLVRGLLANEDEQSRDDSLDVWSGDLPGEVSKVVQEDSGSLSVDDLEEVAGDWFLDEDPSNVELARTEPGIENPLEAKRPPVKPGRTVPYSPAFVPKSAAFPREEAAKQPALPPGAIGLLSAAMPAVQRPPAPAIEDESEHRSTSPGERAPSAPARDDDDHTSPFAGDRPTADSVADVSTESAQMRARAEFAAAGAAMAGPPLGGDVTLPPLDPAASARSSAPGGWLPGNQIPSASVADVTGPAALPDSLRPTGPAWVSPSQPAAPAPTPSDGTGPISNKVVSRPVGRRRRRRKRPARGANTTAMLSLPRLWKSQTVWSSSPVVRGIILGVFLLLLIGLVEGVRRRLDVTSPEKVELREAEERRERELLK